MHPELERLAQHFRDCHAAVSAGVMTLDAGKASVSGAYVIDGAERVWRVDTQFPPPDIRFVISDRSGAARHGPPSEFIPPRLPDTLAPPPAATLPPPAATFPPPSADGRPPGRPARSTTGTTRAVRTGQQLTSGVMAKIARVERLPLRAAVVAIVASLLVASVISSRGASHATPVPPTSPTTATTVTPAGVAPTPTTPTPAMPHQP